MSFERPSFSHIFLNRLSSLSRGSLSRASTFIIRPHIPFVVWGSKAMVKLKRHVLYELLADFKTFEVGMNRICGLILLLAIMLLSICVGKAETEDHRDAFLDANIRNALLSKNYPALADIACKMLETCANEREALLALSALSFGCEGLNRAQLATIMARFERASAAHSSTHFANIAFNDFRISQYARLENDSQADECVRLSGRIGSLWSLPPVIVPPFRDGDHAVPCDAIPSVFGNRLMPITLRNCAFSPFSAAARDRLKSNCHIPIGFSFSVQEDVNDLWLNIAIESRSLLYFDVWPFMLKEGRNYLLEPTMFTNSADGISPTSANNCIRISNLKAGTHTIFVLIPAQSLSSVFFSFLDGAGRPLALDILEPKPEELHADSSLKEGIALSHDSRFLSSSDDLSLFFPNNDCTLDTLAKEHLRNLRLDDLKSLLSANRLISLRRPPPLDFIKQASRQYNSPLVADWLATLNIEGWKKYDEECLKEHANHTTGWIRTVLDASSEAVHFVMLQNRGRDAGYSPEVLIELTHRIRKAEDYQAVASQLVNWPFMPNLLAEIAANPSTPVENRLGISQLLAERTLFPVPHIEMQISLLVEQNNIPSAISLSNQLCKHYHWVAQFWAISGELHLKSGDKLMCIKAWQNALSLDTDYPHLRTLLQALQEESEVVPEQTVSDDELKVLCERAHGIEAKEGVILLTNRFNLRVSDRGVLTGSVIRIYLVNTQKSKLVIPVGIKEWSDFSVMLGKSVCTLRRSSGRTESLSIAGNSVEISNAERGDIVILNTLVERSNWAAYEPYAFDFIPVVTIGVPLIEYRYFLKCDSGTLSSWCSEDMRVMVQNNGILFYNESPFVYNSLPCSPLPSIGWTTLTNKEFAQRIEIEFKSKASVLPTIKDFKADGKNKREIAVSLFNCLRDIIWVKKTPVSALLSPSTATNTFDNKEATAFEFAIIFAAFAEKHGIGDNLRFFVLAEESAFPWAVPKAEDAFFCPILTTSFCALFEENGNPLFIRFSSPFYIKDTVSHHFKPGFALSLRDDDPKFTVFHGFQRQNTMSFSMEVKPDRTAPLPYSIGLKIVYAGDVGENLLIRAKKGFGIERSNFLIRLACDYLMKANSGVNAHPRIPCVSNYYGSEVFINASFTRLFRASGDMAKRIRAIPTDFDLSGIVWKNSKFTPVWVGNLTLTLQYSSTWELSLHERFHNYIAESHSIKLSSKLEKNDDTTTLIIQVTIPDSLNDPAELERYQEIAKDAEEALTAEVIWK